MKKWIARICKSKTMIFSCLLAVTGVIEASTGFLQTILPAEHFGWLVMIVGIVSAVLRVLTTTPLKDK